MANETIIPRVRVPSCPMCNSCSGVIRHVASKDHWFGAPGTWTFRQCQSCNGLWLDPRPTSSALPTLYENYYTHAAELPRRKGRSAWGRLRSHLPWHRMDDAADLGYLSGLVPGRVLDVGCGDGTRLRRLHREGWSPVGVDVDPDAVESARRMNVGEVLLGTAHDVEPARHFDAIVMFHVLEHLEDPVATLRVARELLRPGGTLSVATPNATSGLHEKYGHRWRGLEPPRHLQIFSPSGLQQLVYDAGFAEVDVFTTSRNAGGLAFASQSSYGRKLPALARKALALKSELVQALEWTRLRWNPTCGEELVTIART